MGVNIPSKFGKDYVEALFENEICELFLICRKNVLDKVFSSRDFSSFGKLTELNIALKSGSVQKDLIRRKGYFIINFIYHIPLTSL